jgi:hypothetical protein
MASQVLWEDGDRVFCRGWRLGDDGNASAVLVVLPAAERPSPSSLDRLAHEYGLEDELDGAWAVQPLELVRDVDRVQMIETGCAKGPGTLGARKETTRQYSSQHKFLNKDISSKHRDHLTVARRTKYKSMAITAHAATVRLSDLTKAQ